MEKENWASDEEVVRAIRAVPCHYADLVIVGANVQLVTSSRGAVNGTAGQAINVGQTCYLNTPGDGKVYVGTASGNALQSGNTQAYVALNSTASGGQPIQLFAQGTFNPGANTNLTVGQLYMFSNNAGKICPVTDLGTGSYPTLIGMAISTTQIESPNGGIYAWGVSHA